MICYEIAHESLVFSSDSFHSYNYLSTLQYLVITKIRFTNAVDDAQPRLRNTEAIQCDVAVTHYLYRSLPGVVGDHEVHCNVLTVHVFVDPVTNVRRHHVGKEMTEILTEIKRVKHVTRVTKNKLSQIPDAGRKKQAELISVLHRKF